MRAALEAFGQLGASGLAFGGLLLPWFLVLKYHGIDGVWWMQNDSNQQIAPAGMDRARSVSNMNLLVPPVDGMNSRNIAQLNATSATHQGMAHLRRIVRVDLVKMQHQNSPLDTAA